MPTENLIEGSECKSLELALNGGPKAFTGRTRPFRPQEEDRKP